MPSLTQGLAPFSLLEKAIVYSQGWAEREIYLFYCLSSPSSKLAALEAVSYSQERTYMTLSPKERGKLLKGSPDWLSVRHLQRDSSWVSLVQAVCN